MHRVVHIKAVDVSSSPDSAAVGCKRLPRRAGGRAKIWTDKNVAKLCEVVANGGSFADAAKACKVSEMQARGRFNSIARDFGAQGK